MNAEYPLLITRNACPLCSRELVTNWVPHNIPFFGDVMHITSICECGFRYSDTLILTQREPVHYELNVKSQDDLNARVVRSTSGTIRIPELGIDIEPGSASESFISNIEGVLDRVKDILEMVTRWGEKEKTECAEQLLSLIEKTGAGEYEITVIIEDPMGNSAIIAKNAIRRKLTDEEAEHLRTGTVIFEKEALP
ncbi:ZPR1-related zinc finger protein [Candidatus Methanoperedens nitroreducens]|uniref:ZPR1-related zinc finger protein n=1 Tax=Candidatus Methanoperedens nitratireducens TaxID=1392998 RepID=A0A062UZI7_9EURY|nr:ZPR1-related zinc finger protein [Candidatus Methanoperedens nitroreducens]